MGAAATILLRIERTNEVLETLTGQRSLTQGVVLRLNTLKRIEADVIIGSGVATLMEQRVVTPTIAATAPTRTTSTG